MSEVACSPAKPLSGGSIAASSRVLVRLPLCPSAIETDCVDRNVGCAFAHTGAPVVE